MRLVGQHAIELGQVLLVKSFFILGVLVDHIEIGGRKRVLIRTLLIVVRLLL